MTRRCLIIPDNVHANALKQVLNLFGPPRFSVAGAPAEASGSDSPVDLLVLTGLSALDVRKLWRQVCTLRGDVTAIDVRNPVIRLLGPVAQRERGVRSLPETALFLTSVFHSVFQHKYLSNGGAGLSQLAREYPRWLTLWLRCGIDMPEPTNRQLGRLPRLIGLAQADPGKHWEALNNLAGKVSIATRNLAAAETGE